MTRLFALILSLFARTPTKVTTPTVKRTAVTSLALSAAAFGAIVTSEGWMGTADVPVKGDRCTNGFGSTFKEDGTPVKCGETIAPPQAVTRSLAHIQNDEKGIKACVTAPMTQVEYDLAVDFSYQYGTKTFCNSSIVRHLNSGNYTEACEAYKLYKKVNGYDCSTPGNKRCLGVWERSLARANKCLMSQP